MASLTHLCTQDPLKLKFYRGFLPFSHLLRIQRRFIIGVEFNQKKLKFAVPTELLEPALINIEHVLVDCDYFKISRAVPTPGDVVIDAGAFLGFYTVASSLLTGSSGRVVAIEPNPLVLGYLHTNARVNKALSAVVYPLALCREAGTTRLYIGEYAAVSSTLREHVEEYTSVSRVVEVKCVRLSTLLNYMGHVNIVKLDVEGAELDVLSEAHRELHRVDTVVAELHMDVLGGLHEIERLLETAGFKRMVFYEVKDSSDQLVVYAFR